jgi:hypothetical protein
MAVTEPGTKSSDTARRSGGIVEAYSSDRASEERTTGGGCAKRPGEMPRSSTPSIRSDGRLSGKGISPRSVHVNAIAEAAETIFDGHQQRLGDLALENKRLNIGLLEAKAGQARLAELEAKIRTLEETIAAWGVEMILRIERPESRRRIDHERDPETGRILRSFIVEDSAAADPPDEGEASLATGGGADGR